MVKLYFNYFERWDDLRFGSGLELFDAFIVGVEKDCALMIKHYESSENFVVDDTWGEEEARLIQLHGGLDDRAWDLEAVFKTYFPSLRRSSTLVMLCSFFEKELNELCVSVKRHLNFDIDFKNLQGQGVERAVSYLKLCAGVTIEQGGGPWQSAKKILDFRNALIHGGSKLKDDVATYIADHPLLSKDGSDIIIQEGYLNEALAAFKGSGRIIGDGLRKRFPKEESV
ncbi:hypothetical protein [Dyella sp. GSA-30]|uniref:hypothetical protein n=1 Tax=Dyella sp. GSA-30 TaxID=2994496 RepID=UPI00249143E0|nr:hypothetical protein [Dyella sp. GSA-30]BDU18616.1 hypothetical protein DYGSA30_00730 [Dyella sp. GSA-30]